MIENSSQLHIQKFLLQQHFFQLKKPYYSKKAVYYYSLLLYSIKLLSKISDHMIENSSKFHLSWFIQSQLRNYFQTGKYYMII